MVTKITKTTFSGSSNVFNGFLAGVLMSLASGQAVIAAATVTDIVNNAGGAANGTIGVIAAPANHILVATDSSQKAALETALGTVKDALSEIVRQLNLVRAVVPAFPALTNNIGGTAPDGTIGAITITSAGVGTSLASAAGLRTVTTGFRNAIAQATHFVNAAAAAVGMTPVIDSSGGNVSVATTFAAISTDTGTAVDGSDATDAHAGVLATDAVILLTALRDGIQELATKLNAVTSGTPTVTVVAG